MTKLLIVSDTHGKISKLDDVVRKYSGKFNLLIHLGDRSYDALSLQESVYNIIIIKGNIEIDSPKMKEVGAYEQVLDVEGLRVFATHGHRYSVHSTMVFLKKRAKEVKADLVLFGHTHEKYLDMNDGIMYFNPGALENGDYGVIDIDNGEIVSIDHSYLSDKW